MQFGLLHCVWTNRSFSAAAVGSEAKAIAQCDCGLWTADSVLLGLADTGPLSSALPHCPTLNGLSLVPLTKLCGFGRCRTAPLGLALILRLAAKATEFVGFEIVRCLARLRIDCFALL